MLNIQNNLILVKGEDKTKSITAWRFEEKKPVVWISFGAKEYPYHSADVKFYKNPVVKDVADKLVYKGKDICPGVVQIRVFNEYSRIIYSTGYTELVPSKQVKIINSAFNNPKSKDCFNYLKQLAGEIGLCGPDGRNILAARYEKIDFVREDSMLAALLSRYLPDNSQSDENTEIYPFGFNLSQKQAVDNALSHRLSVIEGPPGTGKTQTILNIIANAVIKGETVAVVSSNNSATANVLEKLEKYGVDFIAAYLGNSANKEAFIAGQKEELPNLASWRLSDEEYSRLQETLRTASVELDEKLEKKNQLSKLQAELDSLEKEYEHYSDTEESEEENASLQYFGENLPAGKILEFLTEYELQETAGGKVGFFTKLIWYFRYHIRNIRLYKQPAENVAALGRKEYYRRKKQELADSIAEIEKDLETFDFDQKMQDYAAVSMQLFKASLAKKYAATDRRKLYNMDDLWKNSVQLAEDYPVILSTTYSLRSSLSGKFAYDYVIVDEASQVDLATGALAFSCAKKAVVVGDLKQLPNVVPPEQKEKTELIFQRYDLPAAFSYSGHSLLSAILELFPNIPKTMLREHYRCHPEIIGFCNQRFYRNELIVLTKPSSDKQAMMVYRTVKGNHARGHLNQRQIDVIREEIIPEQKLNVSDGSVGIVTPYRDQADALKEVFAGTQVKADTVDKFQGQERSAMIFSTVDNEIKDFASDPKRLNVAVSRAVDQFIVVTDGNDNDSSSPIYELIEYIRYHNHDVIDSRVYSVFDYLYKDYALARENVLKRHGRINEIESENLMYQVIRDILNTEEFSTYDVVSHVPLRMILSDTSLLDDRETQFAKNRRTHVDFLVFSKITHLPKLVIEVDGFAFHDKNEKQLRRDAIKDSILNKYGIPIVRFSTVSSGEAEKLREKLLKT